MTAILRQYEQRLSRGSHRSFANLTGLHSIECKVNPIYAILLACQRKLRRDLHNTGVCLCYADFATIVAPTFKKVSP